VEAVVEKYAGMLADTRSPMTSHQTFDAALGLFVTLETGMESLGDEARAQPAEIHRLLAELLRRLSGPAEAMADFDRDIHSHLVRPSGSAVRGR